MTAVLATPTAPVTDVRRTRRRPSGKLLAGLGIAAVFFVIAVVGPLLTGDPEALSYDQLQSPSGAHWLGTTNTGQDVLAQLMSATRGSLTIGVLVGVFATAVSLLIGVVGGYLGGWLDESFSLLSNVFLVLPGLPLVILITDYTQTKGIMMIAAIISVTAWAGPARVLRAQTLSLRNRDYVDAARVAGEPGWRIVVFEILPNLAPIVAAQFVFAVLGGVLIEVGLAFLGLAGGASGSWGGMLYYALSASALPRGAWWWFVPPGLFCALLGTGLSLINFAIDERVNPRLRKETAQ